MFHIRLKRWAVRCWHPASWAISSARALGASSPRGSPPARHLQLDPPTQLLHRVPSNSPRITESLSVTMGCSGSLSLCQCPRGASGCAEQRCVSVNFGLRLWLGVRAEGARVDEVASGVLGAVSTRVCSGAVAELPCAEIDGCAIGAIRHRTGHCVCAGWVNRTRWIDTSGDGDC
jgi:hypothetical protein